MNRTRHDPEICSCDAGRSRHDELRPMEWWTLFERDPRGAFTALIGSHAALLDEVAAAEARAADAERERDELHAKGLAAYDQGCADERDQWNPLYGQAIERERAERARADKATQALADSEARLRGVHRGLRASIEGLELAARCHEAVDMDNEEDEAIKMRAVGTMLLALSAARDALADADEAVQSSGGVSSGTQEPAGEGGAA